ncbi:cysteine dioxygenase [Sciscionella sediminilitoris]|uniref:cysteine dioxygenase n=1 Tax=Sciscionella sediminilitoris TaxID=1445613 RepID=UPI0004DF8C58|nr:cysteine dioxygenase family protein [Sciscionella sp. SE31]
MTTFAETSASELVLHPELHAPGLAALLPADRLLWDPRQLRDLTSTVAREFAEPLGELLRYESPQRWWARLAVTQGVELWLLSWLPGQHTEPHDHGGAAGSFTVFTGRLHEQYRYPGRLIRDADHAAGAALGFDAGRAHQVRNTSDAPAASVHAYSPPAVPTREYDSLRDLPAEIPPLPPRQSFAQVLADTVEP